MGSSKARITSSSSDIAGADAGLRAGGGPRGHGAAASGSRAPARAPAGAPAALWSPSPEWIARTHLSGYMRWAGERHGRSFTTYDELWRWSVQELDEFWGSIWERFGVRASAPYERVLGAREMPGAQWFPGARLNYAEHVLRDAGDELAVVHSSELRGLDTLTGADLARQVAAVAGGLRELGVQAGDRVAAYMPNIAETLVAFLAAASIGAVWSSAAPEFGARSVIDRFAQIEPKVLLAVDGYRYGGRDFDRSAALRSLAGELPGLERVVLLGYLDRQAPLPPLPVPAMSWQELSALGEGAPASFEQLPFEHPLWVLYSSGTTGLPKAIVHSHGGILLEQLKKGYLHLDLHRGERIFWYTTTGWMMWNFLAGALVTDAAVVLYDGSPLHPDPGALWQLAERTAMTHLGTSAGFLTSAMKDAAAPPPGERFDLSRLRAVGSTGSPLSPEGFEWAYANVKRDLWLFSTSGGTDVCTAFVGGCPLLPVYPGELQCRALGCAVDAYDEHGRSLVEEVGELVVREPMPSMPVYLWGDPGGERYRESYFSRYPGVWRHGDWIRISSRGSAVIYGRSDATINRGGVRMGTSEIYRATEALPQVREALVVDLPQAGELRMVLFVALHEGVVLDEALRQEIRRRIREDCSPRHVPDDVLQVDAVPRTLSGKILEVPVKRILMGTPPEQALSRESLANPEALDRFIELAQQRASASGERSG